MKRREVMVGVLNTSNASFHTSSYYILEESVYTIEKPNQTTEGLMDVNYVIFIFQLIFLFIIRGAPLTFLYE